MTRTYSFFIAGFITVLSFSQEATNSSFFLGGEASHKPASSLGNSLMSSSHSQNLQIPNDSQIVSAIAPKSLKNLACHPVTLLAHISKGTIGIHKSKSAKGSVHHLPSFQLKKILYLDSREGCGITIQLRDTVDGRNAANQLIGSLSRYL